MNRQLWPAALAIGVALVLALVAWLGLKQRESVRGEAPPPAASAPAPVRAVEPAPVASAPPSVPLHPIEAVQTQQPAPPLGTGVDAVTAALIAGGILFSLWKTRGEGGTAAPAPGNP